MIRNKNESKEIEAESHEVQEREKRNIFNFGQNSQITKWFHASDDDFDWFFLICHIDNTKTHNKISKANRKGMFTIIISIWTNKGRADVFIFFTYLC